MGMAAHLEGKACSIYDMTGLSQKNGAVYSHLRIAEQPGDLAAQRIGAGEADLLLGFDLLAALTGDAAPTYAMGRTRVIGNSAVVPTVDFQFDRDLAIDEHQVEATIAARTGAENAYFVDASNLALKLLGDTIGANMFVVGYAAQQGLLPMSVDALEKAIELNGTAVPFNLRAFALGRLCAHSPEAVEALLPATSGTSGEQTHLRDYQDQAWADRFLATVEKVQAAEAAVGPGSTALTRAVAANLSKLMSYKDEYEVARLYTDPAFLEKLPAFLEKLDAQFEPGYTFLEKLDAQFEPGYTLKFNLAPPLISRINPATGKPMKREFGDWMLHGFRILAKFKRLRGSALDIFGRSAERRMERQLIGDYEQLVADILPGLSAQKLQTAPIAAVSGRSDDHSQCDARSGARRDHDGSLPHPGSGGGSQVRFARCLRQSAAGVRTGHAAGGQNRNLRLRGRRFHRTRAEPAPGQISRHNLACLHRWVG
jgi:indolepyruvate ferredoxin oxidoreductase